jgi:hypothetical protein
MTNQFVPSLNSWKEKRLEIDVSPTPGSVVIWKKIRSEPCEFSVIEFVAEGLVTTTQIVLPATELAWGKVMVLSGVVNVTLIELSGMV